MLIYPVENARQSNWVAGSSIGFPIEIIIVQCEEISNSIKQKCVLGMLFFKKNQ